MSLQQTINAAKAARAANPAAFGTVTDAALDSAVSLDAFLQPVADRAIARLTTAAKALRPAGPESPAHVQWRARAAAIEPALARAKAKSGQPGSADIVSALYSTVPREPPFDDGGAATEAELATALGAVRVLLNV